ncbi:hypothetical protein BGI41_02875 [Methanobrevibacter sp. 87.7]|uniref:hypothetical protein n=1 Tax=Methanobrevibacter sp. 87.7 TaxID=387957 RepID=UPI000B4FFBE0|nr:hypothetical protein [Methanobrevibacter sp. 87.7]OWT33346.1 hypothetical protein BGI41_02875 [Methanobrevibacter sp. 87.7]
MKMIIPKKYLITIIIILILISGIILIPIYAINNVDLDNKNISMDIKENNTGNSENDKILNSTKNKNPSNKSINMGVNNESTCYLYNNPNWKQYNITIKKNTVNYSDGNRFFYYSDIFGKKDNLSNFINFDKGNIISIKKNNKTIKNGIYFVKDHKSTISVKYKNTSKTYELHNATILSGLFEVNEIKYGFCKNGYDDFENISENTFSKYTYKLYGETYTTSNNLKKYKYGDCWAFSEYLYESLVDAGYTARVLQYTTSSSNVHRSVQIKLTNGSWVAFPYREYGWGNFYDKELNDDINQTNNPKLIMSNENGTSKKFVENSEDIEEDDTDYTSLNNSYSKYSSNSYSNKYSKNYYSSKYNNSK